MGIYLRSMYWEHIYWVMYLGSIFLQLNKSYLFLFIGGNTILVVLMCSKESNLLCGHRMGVQLYL